MFWNISNSNLPKKNKNVFFFSTKIEKTNKQNFTIKIAGVSQLIWIYTVYKGRREYLGSVGREIIKNHSDNKHHCNKQSLKRMDTLVFNFRSIWVAKQLMLLTSDIEGLNPTRGRVHDCMGLHYYTAFHYYLFLVSVWLKQFWRRRKTPNHHHCHHHPPGCFFSQSVWNFYHSHKQGFVINLL